MTGGAGARVCCRYLAYFSCAAANGRHSVGVAVSSTSSPLGPYTDPLGVPLIYHNEVSPAPCSPLQLPSPVQDSVVGCLDQSYFKDPQTGQDYILWKTDEIAFPIRTGVIYIQELQPSGTALLEGSVKQLMIEVDR